jgi:tRNA (cytidine/uridine-2'-O-)-methyltransferase
LPAGKIEPSKFESVARPGARAIRLPDLSIPAFHIVLVRPEIPQNTGSIARLAAATRTRLHLVGPLGFSLEDRYLKRAGLDYWPLVDLRTYARWDDFAAAEHRQEDGESTERRPRAKYFSARATRSYLEANYAPGDFLVFGSETKGLGAEFLRTRIEATYKIPIFEPGVRSLNLANAVSIVLYEALRQTGRLIE